MTAGVGGDGTEKPPQARPDREPQRARSVTPPSEKITVWMPRQLENETPQLHLCLSALSSVSLTFDAERESSIATQRASPLFGGVAGGQEAVVHCRHLGQLGRDTRA